jgi:hypothetical protein
MICIFPSGLELVESRAKIDSSCGGGHITHASNS